MDCRRRERGLYPERRPSVSSRCSLNRVDNEFSAMLTYRPGRSIWADTSLGLIWSICARL